MDLFGGSGSADVSSTATRHENRGLRRRDRAGRCDTRRRRRSLGAFRSAPRPATLSACRPAIDHPASKKSTREAHLPAQHPPPGPQARVSRPHAHSRRPGDHQVPSAQGSDSAVGLIWRIRDRRAFRRLSASDCRSRTKGLWCTYVNDPAAIPLRVAFAVGRSYGPAVRRNRLRRRLRVVVDRVAAARGLTAGWLLVGVSKTPTDHTNEHTFEELMVQVDRLLDRLPRRSNQG